MNCSVVILQNALFLIQNWICWIYLNNAFCQMTIELIVGVILVLELSRESYLVSPGSVQQRSKLTYYSEKSLKLLKFLTSICVHITHYRKSFSSNCNLVYSCFQMWISFFQLFARCTMITYWKKIIWTPSYSTTDLLLDVDDIALVGPRVPLIR